MSIFHGPKAAARTLAIAALTLLSIAAVPARAADKPPGTGGVVDPCNDRLAIAVASDGTFNLGAFPDPQDCSFVADQSWDLMFSWPSSPGTSFTTVRVDGQDAIYGSGTQIQAPTDVNATTNSSAFTHGDIIVTQTLSIVLNPQTGQPDAARIAYTVQNDGATSHVVGVRAMLDTEINYNDGAPFRLPGIGAVETETSLTGTAIPASFQVFQDVSDPDHVAAGTLTGSGAVTPDRFVVAAWGGIVDTLWDYATDPQASILNDSAYATYWNPQPLSVGQERTYVTYFGLGDISVSPDGPLTVAASGPAALECVGGAYQPDPFDIVATIHANDPVFAATTQLNLPPELSLASGTALVQLGNLAAGSEVQVTWSVTAAEQPTATVVEYSVVAAGGDQAPTSVTRSIELPACAAGGNMPPIAQDQSVSTPQDTPVDITLVATDDDLDPLTYTVTTGPSNGALIGSAPTLTYTPDPGFTGSDGFSFTANDGTVDSNIAVVSITVQALGGPPGAPTDVTVTPGNGSAIVSWTPPDDDGGSPIDGYEVTCVATTNADDVHTTTVDGTTTATQVGGLTNDVEYTCTVNAQNANGDSGSSAASPPFTPTASEAQFSMTIDTSQGGVLLLIPDGQNNLGTTGKIKIPPQPGPATDVVVTASLFGQPGEVDATCGGNVCIGQGIEWAVSDPSAIKKMRVKFIEAPQLTHGGSAVDAVAYKDGLPVADCAPAIPRQGRPMPCVVWRFTTSGGGWQVTLLVDGSDPRGRI